MPSLFILVSLLLLPAASGLSVSDFIAKSSACASFYSCEAFNASEGIESKCRCDADCATYGECCYDAQVYNRSRQTEIVKKLQCIEGSFFITACPEDWNDLEVEVLCRNYSPLDIGDSKEPILHLPVTSKTTNLTYSNYYCALCHSDADNITMWDSEMQCFFPDNERTLEENTNILQKYLSLQKNMSILSLQEGTNYSRFDHQLDNEKIIQLIKSDLRFNDESKKWSVTGSNNSDVIMECSFKLAYNKISPASQCSPSINNCAANWTNKEVENLCHAFSAPVNYYSEYEEVWNMSGIIYAETDKEPVAYRNIYCAECNYNPIENPCMEVYDQSFIDFREHSSPIPPLTILLDIPRNIQRTKLLANADCNENETFIHFYNSHDCIVCLVTSEKYIEGACVPKNHCNFTLPNRSTECQGNLSECTSERKIAYNQSICQGNSSNYNYSESCDEYLIGNKDFLSKTYYQMALLDDFEGLQQNSSLAHDAFSSEASGDESQLCFE